MKKMIAGAVVLAAVSNVALADPMMDAMAPQDQVGAILGAALTFGGDKMAEYNVSYYGGGSSNEDIAAGERFYLFGGVYFQHNDTPDLAYGAQVTVGWLFNDITAKNGSISLDRYPLELIPYLKFDHLRFGIGVTKHTNIKFKDDAVYHFTSTADDATGTVVLMEYMFDNHVSVGVRWVDIEYEFKDSYGSTTFDASHVGIGVNYLF